MADEKRLGELLYEERGLHWKVLAEEYEKMSREFAAKAASARRNYDDYQAGRHLIAAKS
jgi:hypothetical protein